jgi:hypothetical protein
MNKHILSVGAGLMLLFLSATGADATNCSPYTYTFSNGTTADATQVNSNFNTIMNCANINLAPIASPSFTGSVGIGTTTPGAQLSVVTPDSLYAALFSGVSKAIRLEASSTTYFITGVDNTGSTSYEPLDIGGSYLTISNSGSEAMRVTGDSVGIRTTAPAQALEVNGEVKIDAFASASATAVCQNAGVLSSCSSSIRYKENVKDADFGLNDILQMRPVTFKWKGRDENDFGLIAEEVAKINPLFVTYKDKKIEGVKYAQLTAVLVNAIKALKDANNAQAAQIAKLQDHVSALERRVGTRSAANDNLRRQSVETNARLARRESVMRQGSPKQAALSKTLIRKAKAS